ncbi:M20 family metallopeptidase [Paenibacillus glycanilyticus]|uniref:M20 metallopeptidase family protein n=1 Tax=Paenibacillus glycanilyticus TaxID=126569 RepID=UPI00203BB9F4|nr:M20 family metallopeptidase [Paenibacillus glycanilyticus]MCM3626337.1 M20 family metallopeptidase [Paenibacillus glycanilyticus]
MKTSGYIKEQLQRLYPDMVRWRRHLHQNPELSFQEVHTSRWIADQLNAFGCEVRKDVGGHGLLVTIKGDLPGPVVALRADIDALPIQDEKECDYRSKVPGVMHACGHDGHTAALLAVASYYQQHKAELAGERRLIFQPAEEQTPGGALRMIEDGALDGVDAIYGVHLWSPLPYGQASTKPGPFMAAADEFTLEIVGLGGHGGMPHKTVDTIVIGSALVQSVQSIVGRNVDPLKPAVVTIGSFQAGTTNNVIAERCVMKGTVRTFDEETRKLTHERLEQLVKHTCGMYGAKYDYHMRIGYPPVVNDEQEAGRFFRVSGELFGEANTIRSEAMMVAEDFSYYLEKVPGCFMFIGAGNEETGVVHAHHHPRFDIDERAMVHSAQLLIQMAEDFAKA